MEREDLQRKEREERERREREQRQGGREFSPKDPHRTNRPQQDDDEGMQRENR